MADVNANIGVNIDTSAALAQLKALQRQISQFHSSIAKSSESATIAQRSLQKNLLGSINSIGAFSAELRTVRTSAESFTNSLEKNKFSMREYFRYAGASTKTFGKLFRSEFDTIGKVAEERVKTLQTQYIKMGRNASGAMEAIAIRPTALNMQDFGTKTAIAAQKQALFNQLMKQGSTNLLNFGKNTQWAGRQLMVGFTIPLSIVGSAATKTFMEMEAQVLKFKKVYGDLFTPTEETKLALDNITELGKQFTKYGIAVSQTVGLAAEAAAAGFQGLDLQRQTTEATRLSVLGQIDSQKALETTISLQNAFGMSSDKLADSINFLNAVENQTVVSLDDITTAIPKVAPVIQQLGGDVKDLTFFIAAMKEGGINASEGANALKSGLAALINPTTKASAMLAQFGINASEIVTKNKGNLKATVVEFATALNKLDPLNRAQAIEQMFGKFQFARLSTLFANVAKDGNQAARVLDLANSSVQELSALSEKELGMTADSSMNKFKKSVEDLKVALIPVGKAFLEAATPIIEFVGGVLEKFGNLSDGTKKLITFLTVGIGAIGPIFLMTFGLISNAIANGVKGAMLLRQGYLRLTGQSQILGEQTQYLNTEQLEAAAAAHSLDQSHARLTQRFTAETVELQKLIAAYQSAARAGQSFMFNNPGMMMPPRGGRKLASGIVSVPGPKGAGDIVPAMLSPGEAVIPSDMAKKYAPLIQGMIANNIPGYRKGRGTGTAVDIPGGFAAAHFGGTTQKPGAELRSMVEGLDTAFANQIRKMVSEVENGLDRLFTTFNNEVIGTSTELNRAVGKQGSGQTAPIGLAKRDLIERGEVRDIELQRQLTNAGTSIEEFKVINKKITDEIKVGFEKLGNVATVTAEDLDKLTSDAYNKIAETNKKVKDAQIQMRKTSVVTDPRNDSRIAVGKDPYTKFRKGGKYFSGMEQMVSSVPYEKNARFTITKKMAEGLGQTSEEAAVIYNKFSNETKRRLAGLRKDLNAFTREFTIEAAKVGSKVGASVVSSTASAAGTASPSKKTTKIGEDIARGLEVGMANRQKSVAAAGTKLANSAVDATRSAKATQSYERLYGAGNPIDATDKSIRRNLQKQLPLSQIGPNIAMSPQISEGVKATATNIKSMNDRLKSFDRGLMTSSFAISSLAGVASMSGGKLGEMSGSIFKVTTAMFALQAITNLLTQSGIARLATERGMSAGLLVQNTATRKAGLNTTLFSGGIKKLLPNLLNFGKIIARFLGPIGLVISGLLVAKGGFDLFNKAKEKERMATEGLADAMTMTSEKVKLLAGLLGQTPTARAGSGARVSANQLNATEQTAVDELRGSKEFLDKYKKDIEAIKTGTVKEAEIAFNAIALDLGGQGFTKEAVKAYIDALGEEAGKTQVSLKFKQIDLSTEEGKNAAVKLAKDTTEGFNKAFKGGVKVERQLLSTRGGIASYGPEKIKLTNEQQKQLNITSAALGNTLTALTSAFGNQTIKADEYNKKMAEISATIPKGTEGMLLMDKILLNVAPKFAEAAKGVTDYDTKLLLVKAALVNASVGQDIFNRLMDKNPAVVAAARKELEKYRIVTDAIAKNVVVQPDTYVPPAGDVKKSAFTLAKEDLIAQRKELENTRNAYSKLKSSGMEAGKAFEAAKNPILAAAIATTKVGSKNWKVLVGLIKQVNSETKKTPLSIEETFDVVEQSIEAKYRNAIKTGEAAVETAQKTVDGIEKEISKIQDSIEKKQRDIELTFSRPIETLQAESSVLSEQLKDIDKATEEVNTKYDAQEKALNQISEINQDIVEQEKSRLTIADALSQGDISAAAKAAQEMRATAAQASIQRGMETLQAAREFEISGLKSTTGLTKSQIAQKQLEIEKQIYALEQKRTVNATAIRVEEDQIYTIQQGRLLTAKNTVITAEEELTKTKDKLKADLDVIVQQRQFWADTKLADDLKLVDAQLYKSEIAKTQANAQSVLDTILKLNTTVTTTHVIKTVNADNNTNTNPNTNPNKDAGIDKPLPITESAYSQGKSGGLYGPTPVVIKKPPVIQTNSAGIPKLIAAPTQTPYNPLSAFSAPPKTTVSYRARAMGGIIPKYYVSGGYSKGTDTIPAMLTPGEFVVRRNAVDSFGVNNLNKINDGSYGGSSVYNYSLSVNVKSDSSPDDIARTVMTQIKRIDSQRIKTQRGA